MPKIVDHDLQRHELSVTAANVVAELGLENTTLRNVAAAHGCTKGMVQHYFADKEELLHGALMYVESRAELRLEACEGEGLDLLHERFKSLLPLNEQIRREWCVRIAFNTRAAHSETMREDLSQRYQAQLKQGVALLKKAVAKKQARKDINARNEYRALMALVSGLAVSAVMNPSQLPVAAQRKILESCVNHLRR